jgi:hypothetical protein
MIVSKQNSGYPACRSSFNLDSDWKQVQDVSEYTPKKTSSSGRTAQNILYYIILHNLRRHCYIDKLGVLLI